MQTLTTRAFVGEDDLAPIADLLNACEAVDKLDEGISVEELRVEFKSPAWTHHATCDSGRMLKDI